MHEFEIRREDVLPLERDEVFAFFAEPTNLGRITPPWMDFAIVGTPPRPLFEGARIDYRLRVRGVPLRWRSRIEAWEPPHRFVDVQERGPYRSWVHEHRFEPTPGGTRVVDHVRYAVPSVPLLGRPVEALVDRYLVRPDLERIFDHRAERVRALLVAPEGRRRRA